MSDEMLEDAPSIQAYLNGGWRCSSHRGGAAASPRRRHERAGRGLRPVRRPGDQHLHEARRRRQRGRAREGDRQHRRVGVPAAGRDHHAPDQLAHHPPAPRRHGRHGGPVLRRRAVPGAYGNARRGAACSARAVEHCRSCCPPTSGPARRWSATSARAPTSGDEAACRSRRVEQPLGLLRRNYRDAGRSPRGARAVPAGRIHGRVGIDVIQGFGVGGIAPEGSGRLGTLRSCRTKGGPARGARDAARPPCDERPVLPRGRWRADAATWANRPPPVSKLLADRLAEARVDGCAAGAGGSTRSTAPARASGWCRCCSGRLAAGHREGRSGAVPRYRRLGGDRPRLQRQRDAAAGGVR